jgi:hypothetical protein
MTTANAVLTAIAVNALEWSLCLLPFLSVLTSPPHDAIPDHLMPQTLLNPKGLSDTQLKPARRKERAGSQLLDSRVIVFMTEALAAIFLIQVAALAPCSPKS